MIVPDRNNGEWNKQGHLRIEYLYNDYSTSLKDGPLDF